MRRKTLLLALLLSLTASPAWALNYYMAASGGSNTTCAAARAIGTPAATFAFVLPCLVPGDTLNLRVGTYTQGIDSNSLAAAVLANGTSFGSGGYTIKNYNGESVTLRPSASGGTVINIPGPANRQFISIEVITLDGQSNVDNVISVGACQGCGSSNIRFVDVTVRNGGHHGIFFHWPGHHFSFIRGSILNTGNNTLYPKLGSGAPIEYGHYGCYCEAANNLIDGTLIDGSGEYGIHSSNSNGAGANTNNSIYRHNILRNNNLNRTGGYSSAVMTVCTTGCKFYDNIVYSAGGHGIQIGAGCSNCEVSNNTVYGGQQTGIRVEGGTGNLVRNNISYNNNLAGSTWTDISNAGSGTILATNLCTTGVCSITQNPLFTNAASGDFTLQAGSPAINAGTTLATVPDDFALVARPQGPAYDIGAYERVTGSPPDTTPPVAPAIFLSWLAMEIPDA